MNVEELVFFGDLALIHGTEPCRTTDDRDVSVESVENCVQYTSKMSKVSFQSLWSHEHEFIYSHSSENINGFQRKLFQSRECNVHDS